MSFQCLGMEKIMMLKSSWVEIQFSTDSIRQRIISVNLNIFGFQKSLNRFEKYGSFAINTRINSGVYDRSGFAKEPAGGC